VLSRHLTSTAIACLAAVLAVGCSVGDGPEEIARGEASPGAPNLIVIVTDDQTMGQFTPRTMPRTHRALVREGVSFSDFVVTTPLCCPSRASFLTGQYAHNNGVVSNTYLKLRDKPNVLPGWLQHAGYTTAHVGKYLNNYAKDLDDEAAATPGWDEWFTVLEPERYTDFSVSDNGKVVAYGSRDRDYLTRVLSERAVDTVERLAPKRAPFYLQLDHFAPHIGKGATSGPCPDAAAPQRRDLGTSAPAVPSRHGSFDEGGVGRASPLSSLPRLGASESRRIDRRYRCAVESLRAVDRGIGRLVSALEDLGELDETAIAFTSDNGFFYGEHRIPKGKHYPYEEAIRVPLVIRPPSGVPYEGGRTSAAPVANIDLAPTLLELASATPCIDAERCREVDGRSMLPLLVGSERRWPADRPRLIELDLPPSNPDETARPCRYQAVRTSRDLYVRYTSVGTPGEACAEVDEEELYSLADDRAQSTNRLADPTAKDARLAERLRRTAAELSTCGERGGVLCP
jgi:arylsulfatase A-like enzyme